MEVTMQLLPTVVLFIMLEKVLLTIVWVWYPIFALKRENTFKLLLLVV